MTHGITNGQEMTEVGCRPAWVFGKTSPDSGGQTGISPGLQQLYKTWGEAVSEPPNPPGPLTFKYSSRTGKGSQLMFLKY